MDVLRKVRARNPDAWIVWAFGMLGEGRMGAVLRAAVARAAAECGDSRMCYLALPAATPDTMGAPASRRSLPPSGRPGPDRTAAQHPVGRGTAFSLIMV